MTNVPSPRKLAFLLTIACCALLPAAFAVDPPPDGGYPGSNTAEGEDALFSLTTGVDNTAIGFQTLYANTTASFNTAVGYHVLLDNTSGGFNTAIGTGALANNTIGSDNTASGALALANATIGNFNTANGFSALQNTTTGSNNTAEGQNALMSNVAGSNNTAVGQSALSKNAAGTSNIAVGTSAGSSLTSGSNNIYLAALGASAESNVMRLGKNGVQKNTYIAGVSGVTVAGGIGMVIDSGGHIGTSTSSARYKEQIKPMEKASEAILSLKPVTFRYHKELDPAGIPQFGLVAEEVEKVNPDLVARDEQGKPYTVRYEAVNAMLLNEFLKEHRKVEEQALEVKSLKRAMTQQQAENKEMMALLKEQAAQIQKVSNQLRLQASPSRVVADN